ncbi:OB-fold nucleic acid binding domain-containing protein [Propioniciclava soli]|uniref:OB-fold nucleic acid binding domain-containing protein n=1 Tax=Propioniciclava soli TaxID=2775081 RepID=A0ABZ3CB84_9ACTN|nr:OB-fold nucleic acid binding domain-containing protein [Propioniciclava soli]
MGLFDGLRRVFASDDELTSADRHRLAEATGADAIADVRDRSVVTLRGTVEQLTVRPRRPQPWLEAQLSDGTGRVTLIWMGRHEIPGIEAGRELLVQGRVGVSDGVRRIHNPRYTLL